MLLPDEPVPIPLRSMQSDAGLEKKVSVFQVSVKKAQFREMLTFSNTVPRISEDKER